MAIEMTPELARGLLKGKWERRKVSEEDVATFLAKWDEHDPVMPVSMVCDALVQWRDALRESSKEQYRDLGKDAYEVFFAINKSNLLWRLIFLGEKLRTKPCPVHQGRWSGCNDAAGSGCQGACMSGGNVTGWLPEPEDARGGRGVPVA